MKKTLLSIFGALAVSSAVGQASASWATLQNANWPKVSMGVRILSAVDANVVWATGYDGTAGNVSRNYSYFTRTINGGSTYTSGIIYQSVTTPAIGDTTSYQIANFEGVDANTAWVSAFLKPTQNKGAIHKTTNGGVTWTNMTATGMYTNSASFCNVVTFLTPLIGITMGDPNGTGNEFEIWRTIDGGTTWTPIPGASIPNPATANEFGLTGVYTKQGTSNVWFGTNEGRIYRTTDAGLTWNVATLNSATQVNEIAFVTPLNGYAWAYAGANLEQYKTTDGGATWTLIPAIHPNLGLNNMGAIPGTSQFASCGAGASNNIISYSTNGGTTWTDWGSAGIQYLTVDFVNNSTGWASTFSDPTTVGVGGIYKYSGPSISDIVISTNIPSTVCFSSPSSSINVTNSTTGSGTITYTWSSSPAAVFSSTSATNPSITFTATGNYTISVVASNSTGTSNYSTAVNVQACATPTAAFNSNANACVKVVYTTTNTSTGSPTPTYNWSVTPTATVSNATATSPSFTFGAAGIYSITLTASNVSGTTSVTHTVSVAACPPNVGFNIAAAACASVATTVTNTSSSTITPVTYAWSSNPGGTAPFSSFTALNPSVTYTASGVYTITLIASNPSGTASAVHTVTVSDCVGINENPKALSFISVYPNPSNGVFNVANSLNNDVINYTVTNILGSVISSGKFTSAKNIDLSNNSKGIYFITFENNGSKMSKKIVVE